MISVEEAKRIVMNQFITQKIESIGIKECLGSVLAENIFADRDLPPFDRVTMDGIAIKFIDIEKGFEFGK